MPRTDKPTYLIENPDPGKTEQDKVLDTLIEWSDDSHAWRRSGNLIEWLAFDDDGEISHVRMAVDCFDEDIADAFEAIVTAAPAMASAKANEEGWPFTDAQVEAAALAKFCREHPLGSWEAKKRWDELYPDILHVDATGPYSFGSRYNEAMTMLEAAGGIHVD